MNKIENRELLRYLGINKDDSEVLTSKEVVLAIDNLRKKAQMIIEGNMEVGISEDIKKAVLSLISEKAFEVNEDIVLNKFVTLKDAKNAKGEFIYEFIEQLDEDYLHMIVEPNNNVYIDVNYTKLKRDLKNMCASIAMPIFIYSEKVQRTAIVSKDGKLSRQFFDLKNEMIVNTDFEKDASVFKYCSELIDYLDLVKNYIERGI